MPAPTPRAILQRAATGGLVVALISLWNASWLSALLLAVRDGWLYSGVDVPAEILPSLRFSPDEVLGDLWRILHLPLPTEPFHLVLVVTAIGLAGGFLLTLFAVLVRLDETGQSLRALAWSVRTVITPRGLATWFFFLVLVPMALAVVAWKTDSLLAGGICFGYLALAPLAIPFLACRAHVASGQRAWWAPTSPSRHVVLTFLALAIVAALPGWLERLVLPDLPLAILIAIAAATLPIDCMASLAQATVLLTGSPRSALREVLHPRWKVWGPWLAWHALLGLLALLALGPFLAGYLLLWRVIPVLATAMEALDRGLPFAWVLAVKAMRLIGRYWWLIVPALPELAYWLGAGRLLHTLGVCPEAAQMAPHPAGTDSEQPGPMALSAVPEPRSDR